MRRRIQMFFSVVLLLASLAGAVAISQIRDWDYTGTTSWQPGWARWLAVGVLILGVASPIVTWPRPLFLRRHHKV